MKPNQAPIMSRARPPAMSQCLLVHPQVHGSCTVSAAHRKSLRRHTSQTTVCPGQVLTARGSPRVSAQSPEALWCRRPSKNPRRWRGSRALVRHFLHADRPAYLRAPPILSSASVGLSAPGAGSQCRVISCAFWCMVQDRGSFPDSST